eukprot:CAMPEP_0173409724 /NCGR_PEP_ID=MMETSP1356-20130122/72882_1 /TAXON_ID=77927 ORGANISM="Hemiselmis virescens, Strain PCC157" /NCGR_SAMPLE_ID=MMETSP1356 /ASSEMBLY_ACC=CAM_ASM_000847 /LENGTH=61 /DNA_ID=CAMNT_0014371251 /DNA_START=24 /DNA_END=206 /DNA_ORIENTATION=-
MCAAHLTSCMQSLPAGRGAPPLPGPGMPRAGGLLLACCLLACLGAASCLSHARACHGMYPM